MFLVVVIILHFELNKFSFAKAKLPPNELCSWELCSLELPFEHSDECFAKAKLPPNEHSSWGTKFPRTTFEYATHSLQANGMSVTHGNKVPANIVCNLWLEL